MFIGLLTKALSGPGLEDALQCGRFPSAYDAGVYFSSRLRLRVPGRRGRHESDGRWEPFFDDEKDGYDTIEWAAKQRWSNGKVGMEEARAWTEPMAGRSGRTAEPGHHLPERGIHEHLPRLDHAQWRLAPVFQFRLGPVRQESRIMQTPVHTP
jgi:hypothetical protein